MKRDVDFLYEVGSLRFVGRTWSQFFQAPVANNAEHTFRVMWLALLMAREEGANHERVMKMALLHDLSETRTGDTNYVSRMYTARNDAEAYHDVFLDTVFENECGALAKEYSERVTLEAKVVKDADVLDVDLEIQEQRARGHTLSARWAEDRRKGVYPKLYTASARRIFDEVYATDPAHWHLSAKNRFTAGDYKPDSGNA